jgi:hypothetical protein
MGRVVGTGSVGTRTWIVLLLDRDDEDPLFLQFKEAQASVLEPYPGKSRFANHGKRVAEFAAAYADQNQSDYQALLDAVKSGRVKAETGVTMLTNW